MARPVNVHDVGYTIDELRRSLLEFWAQFDAHNHDGISSKSFDAIMAKTIQSQVISIRKGQYTDPVVGMWAGIDPTDNLMKLYVGDATNYLKWDGTTLILSGYAQRNIGTFGGDGSDGALTIAAGTTTVNLGGLSYVTKNYSSISITGTGVLAFSNPHANGTIIVIKCRGDMTLSSSATPMIDISNCGPAGGAGATRSSAGGAVGTGGTGSVSIFLSAGAGGGGSYSGSPTGAAGTTAAWAWSSAQLISAFAKYRDVLVPGAGGGGGSVKCGNSSTATAGTGGRGAGALAIECAGTLNFTTAGGLSITGTVGANSSGSGANRKEAGGGGGGSGSLILLYNVAGTISGTVTTTAAAGGTGINQGSLPADGNDCAGGGGGGAIAGAGATGAAGTTGAIGGAGFSLVAQNTEFS